MSVINSQPLFSVSAAAAGAGGNIFGSIGSVPFNASLGPYGNYGVPASISAATAFNYPNPSAIRISVNPDTAAGRYVGLFTPGNISYYGNLGNTNIPLNSISMALNGNAIPNGYNSIRSDGNCCAKDPCCGGGYPNGYPCYPYSQTSYYNYPVPLPQIARPNPYHVNANAFPCPTANPYSYCRNPCIKFCC